MVLSYWAMDSHGPWYYHTMDMVLSWTAMVNGIIIHTATQPDGLSSPFQFCLRVLLFLLLTGHLLFVRLIIKVSRVQGVATTPFSDSFICAIRIYRVLLLTTLESREKVFLTILFLYYPDRDSFISP